MLFSNLFHSQGNAKVKNVYNFLKRTIRKFLDNNNLKWDDSFNSFVIAITYFQAVSAPNVQSSLHSV